MRNGRLLEALETERTIRLVLNEVQGPEQVEVGLESRPPRPGNEGADASSRCRKVRT